MAGAAKKSSSSSEAVAPRTLGAPAAEIQEIVTHGPRLAIAAADLLAVVVERTTGRIQWRSEAWTDRLGMHDTLARHLPDTMELAELPLPPAGESWRRARIFQTVDGDELLFDLVLIGASTERGTHFATVLATERIGSGMVVTDRPELIEILEEALIDAEPDSVASIYIDLDRFEKVVNAVGTVQSVRLIEQVARKISSTMRATDMLFRLQGDEFLIVAVGLSEKEQGEELGERVRSAIATLPEPAPDLMLSVSVGVALNSSDDTAQSLLASSETAVHLAKGRGRNRVVLSDGALPSRNERLVTVERQLRRAIEHRNVRFAYQPLVRIADRKIVGAEALLRIGGDVGLSASEVVSTAEQSGLMGSLGILVIEGVEEQIGDWLLAPGADRLAMINVAASQLDDEEFLGLLERIAFHDELADHFGLEMAATNAFEHLAQVTKITSRLGPNVKVGADGWSNLDIPLKALADAGVSYMKLHRNLITQLTTDEGHRDRIGRLVREGRDRNIDVIAMGVEKETELEALKQVGCELAQGFLFSKAVSAHDFLTAAAAQRA
ncbi:MAG: EAL domain-containing protein [Acidimicrobiales bacterium]|nr:EAL domain-containing protein [Acidimicrobiales bacterium]